MKQKLYKLISLLLIGIPVHTFADTCPPPSSSIDPTVSSSVSFDKKSGFYTYKYELKNGMGSQIPIDFFALKISVAPSSIQSPIHWLPDMLVSTYMPIHFYWRSTGSNDLKPSKLLTGFSFQSKQLPGVIQYYTEGDTEVPSSSPPMAGAADDEPEPNCPDWDFDSPRFQTIVTGVTTGPSNPNTISVAIRLRDEKNEHNHHLIDPKKPTGKISVLVLGSKNFDPGQIDTTSLKFGPKDAKPLSSKLIPEGKENIASWDEHEEWEKHVKTLDPDFHKNYKKQNLLLVFDEAALGVQCILDKAIFLTGKTKDKVNIIGSSSTRLVGCDIKHPGKRHHGENHASNDGGY